MSTDRWQRIKGLFEQAQNLAPSDRAVFLDGECGADGEMRAEVESLLESFEDAGGFMDRPAVGEVAELIAGGVETLAAGQRIGPYEVIRVIGAGGMGEIYLAHDSRLDRQVALKILPAQFTSDADRARRFKQEARAASGLNHPNIITIYEIGEVSTHQLFIATEYIEGRTLRQAEGYEPLDLRDVVDIAVQVTAALSAAHAAGIVHRDIKPENIMLRPDGVVKVLDFGLAKLAERKFDAGASQAETATYHVTAPGLVMGTVNYMSPEQARGLPVDARTDIFSCGVMLYEMLAGRTPFASDTNADTIAAILKQEPPPLGQFVQELPPELQRIVGKMLRKDQDERYQSAKDLLLDLKDLRDELQVRAKLDRIHGSESSNVAHSQTLLGLPAQTTAGAGQRSVAAQSSLPTGTLSVRSAGRRWYWLAALVGVATVAIGGVWLWRSRANQRPLNAIKVARVVQITSWPGLDDFAALSPDGRSLAYCSDHSGSFEIYVKALAAGAKEIQLTSDGKQNLEPVWSPDGQYIAYYSKLNGGIWIIPAAGGQVKQLTEFGSSPTWSPDGSTIAFQSNPLTDLGAGAVSVMAPSTIWLIPVQGGEPKQITRQGKPAGGHGIPAWSPDGKRLAFTAGNYSDYSTWTMSVDGSGLQPIANHSYAVCFSADGKSVLYAANARVQQVAIDPATGVVTGTPVTIEGIGGLPTFLRRLSFSADGKRLAFSTSARSENLVSLKLKPASAEADGAPTLLFRNTSNRTHMPAFSPDGKRLVFATCLMNGTRCDIWQINADGSDASQLTTDAASELMPSWLPDMTEVAYVSDRLGHGTLWAINLNTKREHLLLDVKDDIAFPKLSPDGQRVAYNGTRDGVINVWVANLADGKPKQLTFDKEMMAFPSWSPDGQWLAFQTQRGDDTNVTIVPAAGGEPIQITNDKGQSWSHGWSPDSDKVLFAGFRNGVWNVWWVSRTTKKEQLLTNYTKLNSFVRYPAWSPHGDQIVYEYSETTGNVWVADLE